MAAFAGPSRIRVLFDQAPARPLRLRTRFADVAAMHDGVQDSPRRPDILVLGDGPKRRAVMVEVKRTLNERYKSDSIYKAFAYLHDFAALWVDRPGCPRLILLLPEAARPKPGAELHYAELVVVGTDARKCIADALRIGLGLAFPPGYPATVGS